MTDAFVVFGSKSDEGVYLPLVEKLKKVGISSEFHVLSAHKTLRELESTLRDTNASIFIAGAGLSAALPGIIAAKVIKPVIGVPCLGAFDGVDAFLSCVQMPSDVPVIAVGVENTDSALSLASNYLHGFSQIVLIEKKEPLEKKFFLNCKKFMEENNFPFAVEKKITNDYQKVFVDFNKLGKKLKKMNSSVINVLVNEKSSKKDVLKFFDSLQDSYSVGLNNYKNAAIIALELINLKGEYSNLLVEMRKNAEKKVIAANK